MKKTFNVIMFAENSVSPITFHIKTTDYSDFQLIKYYICLQFQNYYFDCYNKVF